MQRLCFFIVITVVLASAGDAQTYAYGISGQVTWDGMGPVPNFVIGWGIFDTGPMPRPPLPFAPAVTDMNGKFSTLVRVPLFGRLYVTCDHQISGLDYPFRFGFNDPTGGAKFNVKMLPLTILVHGLNGGPVHWELASHRIFPQGGLDVRTDVFPPTARVFLEHDWKRSHVENARILAERIKAIEKEIFASMKLPPAPMDLNLVCHNSAGLVARAYIANHTGGVNEDRVLKCVTVGTPHLGMAWLEALPENHPLFVLSKSLYQMRPSYLLHRFPLELRKGYGSTKFYLMGSSLNINPMEPEIIQNWPFSKDDDGLVSTFSATYAFPGAKVVAVKNFPYLNDQFPLKIDVVKQIVDWIRNP